MVSFSVGRKKLWQYSHSAAIFTAVLLFTAGFLCVLLWTNDIVHTPTSAGDASTSTFTTFSPAVSTFSITYNVVSGNMFRVNFLLTTHAMAGYIRYSMECNLFRHAPCLGT